MLEYICKVLYLRGINLADIFYRKKLHPAILYYSQNWHIC